MTVEIVSPRAAVDYARQLDGGSCGPTMDEPVLVVAGGANPEYDKLVAVAGSLPCVVLVLGDPGAVPPGGDVALTAEPDPPRPWVGGIDEAALEKLVAAILANPTAAVTLVQAMRAVACLPAGQGLVAESIAYGLLQGGPEHRRWLSQLRAPRGSGRSDKPVVITRDGDRLQIVLSRPEVRNAYSAAMRDALVSALMIPALDSSITAVQLSGAGPVFCSGGDLTEFGRVPDPVTAHTLRSVRNAGVLLETLRGRLTAHVHGPCVGAGVELPAFAQTVVSREDATFRLPEIAMGLIPGAGGTVSIGRRIGRHRATWMALTGASVDAQTALAWGLVDEIG